MPKNRIKDMTVGNPVILIISFTLPLAAGQFLQQFYVVVDAAIVGQFVGVDALAGIGATDWLYWLFLWTASGFGQGFAIPVAIYYGEKDYGKITKSVNTAVLLSGMLGILMSLIGLAAAKPLLLFLNTPQELMPYSYIYLLTLYGGLCVVMMYNMSACILRALGDGKTPFIALLISSCLNVGLDLVFVIVFKWGVAGAGFATVLSQLVSTVYTFYRIRKISILQMEQWQWRLDMIWCRNLLKKGTPMAFQMIFIALGGIVFQSVLNQYGVAFVAGFAATNKLIGVLEAIAMSLGYAMTTYMGQNYGAKRFERIQSGMRSAIGISVAVSFVIGLIMVLFGRKILTLFISGNTSSAEEALNIGFYYLCVLSAALLFLHMLHVYRQSLAGFGNTFVPMLSGFAEGAVRGIIAIVLTICVGAEGLFFVEALTWTSGALFALGAYYVYIKKIKRISCEEKI